MDVRFLLVLTSLPTTRETQTALRMLRWLEPCGGEGRLRPSAAAAAPSRSTTCFLDCDLLMFKRLRFKTLPHDSFSLEAVDSFEKSFTTLRYFEFFSSSSAAAALAAEV